MNFCPYCGRLASLVAASSPPLPLRRCIYCSEEVVAANVAVEEVQDLERKITKSKVCVDDLREFIDDLNLATMTDPPTALLSESLRAQLHQVLETINAVEDL